MRHVSFPCVQLENEGTCWSYSRACFNPAVSLPKSRDQDFVPSSQTADAEDFLSDVSDLKYHAALAARKSWVCPPLRFRAI